MQDNRIPPQTRPMTEAEMLRRRKLRREKQKRRRTLFLTACGLTAVLVIALMFAFSGMDWFYQFTDSGLLSSQGDRLVTVLIGGILLVLFLVVTFIGILLVRSDLRIERERRKKPPEPPDEFSSLYEWLNSKAAGKDP